MTIDKDEQREQRTHNIRVFALALVLGVGAGWLLAHPTLFDRTRFQALHSLDSGYPFPVLFLASTLLGLFLGTPAVNLLLRSGFSFWSLLPPLIWFGFGVHWIEDHVISWAVADQIEGLASWGILWLPPNLFFAGFLFRYRLLRRRLAGPWAVATDGSVWPPPPRVR